MMAHSQRLVNHCMVLPNYNMSQQLAGMQNIKEMFGVGAWKVYTPWGPNGTGYYLDDAATGIPMIQKGLDLGVNLFCAHKGVPLPGFDTVHTQPARHRRRRQDVPDRGLHRLPLGVRARRHRARRAVRHGRHDRGELPHHVDAHERDRARPERLRRARNDLVLDHERHDAVGSRARQAAQVLRRGQRRLGHRLGLVRAAAAADRRLHEVPDLHPVPAAVRLSGPHRRHQAQDLSASTPPRSTRSTRRPCAAPSRRARSPS